MKRRPSTPKKTSKKATRREVTRVVSIPSDVVLAPQAEAPRQLLGNDRSARASVRELTWPIFDRLVSEMAREVKAAFNPEMVVGVAHGGVFVGGALASALRAEFFPVRISRRSRDQRARKSPRMSGEMPPELKGRRVLIVDDVAASGDTLELARALAEKVKARELRTATLVMREEGYRPDFCALESDELVVFPWDYEEVASDERFDVDPDKAGA